jgi:hypothetical protein
MGSTCLRAEVLTAFLADAKCAAGGKAAGAGHASCARKCARGGEAIVLVSAENSVYKIKSQDKVKIMLAEE